MNSPKQVSFLIFLLCLFVVMATFWGFSVLKSKNSLKTNTDTLTTTQLPWWKFQSIDTMKFSRDESRRYLDDLSKIEAIAEDQIKLIAETGATHVAIATPYDEEFLPVLEVWVRTARKYNLLVWFRGNWSGWEGWFEYPRINRAEHLSKSKQFVAENISLFKDGDVFSACPECENGGPGDPRMTGDVVGHRKFLIEEHQQLSQIFKSNKVDVSTSFNSMNGDVARLVMDPETTQALGGIVVIDHYVATPEKLASDIKSIAQKSGGKIVLGEIGVPIPDIHGQFTDSQQAAWMQKAFMLLAPLPELIGVNYWTGVGGSTELWNKSGKPVAAVSVIKQAFTPRMLIGTVTSNSGTKLAGVAVSTASHEIITDKSGLFAIPTSTATTEIEINKDGYTTVHVLGEELERSHLIALTPVHEGVLMKIVRFFQQFINK